MNKALKRHVLPVLRQKGFKGSLPHFRRFREKQTDLLTFQFSMSGGRFVVEISECPPGDFITDWGKVIPANKVTAHNMWKRLRLGSYGTADHWFSYESILPTDESAYDAIAESVLPHLNVQAEEWWNTK